MQITATILFLLLTALPSFATTWNVGPTRTYKMPSEVVSLVQNGDTVLIDAGTYRDVQFEWTTFGVSIIGVGRVVLLPDTTQVASSTWTIVGGGYWLYNLEFRDGLERTDPGSGLRILGVSCRVDSCVFVRNRRGIDVIETVESSILIRASVFEENDDADVNVGGKQSVSVFNCWFRGSTGAVNIRSAAAFHFIHCNMFSNEQGSVSTSLHVQNGGSTQLIGNVFRSAGLTDSTRHIVRYDVHTESNTGMPNHLLCAWNTFVNDGDSISFVELNGTVAALLEMKNTVVAGKGTLVVDASDSARAVIDVGGNYSNGNVDSVGFVNPLSYDYHLSESSPVRGTVPFDNVPKYGNEYAHPLSMKDRFSWTSVGAFEYVSATSVVVAPTDRTTIRIAPNPAHTSCTFSIPPSLLGHDVVIVGMNGNEVARYVATQMALQIDVASLSAGMYVVQLGVHSTLLGIYP